MIETYPETILIIEPGTKKGEILEGPEEVNTLEFSSIVVNPPIPDPIITPVLAASFSSLAIQPEF